MRVVPRWPVGRFPAGGPKTFRPRGSKSELGPGVAIGWHGHARQWTSERPVDREGFAGPRGLGPPVPHPDTVGTAPPGLEWQARRQGACQPRANAPQPCHGKNWSGFGNSSGTNTARPRMWPPKSRSCGGFPTSGPSCCWTLPRTGTRMMQPRPIQRTDAGRLAERLSGGAPDGDPRSNTCTSCCMWNWESKVREQVAAVWREKGPPDDWFDRIKAVQRAPLEWQALLLEPAAQRKGHAGR